jgi:hypothetical protein
MRLSHLEQVLQSVQEWRIKLTGDGPGEAREFDSDLVVGQQVVGRTRRRGQENHRRGASRDRIGEPGSIDRP